MKKLLLFLLLTFTFLFFPSPTLAHLAGQPPFFKINDQYTLLYPVPATSLEDFNLPQDIGPENYLINQTLNFSLEIAVLPVLPEIVSQTKFYWDFGDGTKKEGLKTSHSFSKPGSYFIVVNAQYGTDQPQLLQSTLVNIIPQKDYSLPKSVIKVNGKQSKDPLTDLLKFNFKDSLQFDGSFSESPNSQITSYQWDFGDGQESKDAITTHKYESKRTQVFPVLRVIDSNGFIVDSFLEIENDQNTTASNISKLITPSQKPNQLNKIILGVVITALVIGILLLITLKKSKKRRH